MKQRGRDVLIGILVGAALIIWVTSRHDAHHTTPRPHPSASASASHSHAKTPAAKTPAAKTRAATHKVAPASTHPTTLTHTARTMASSKPADSGIGNGVIAIGALVAIGASLFTVTLTVRHLRADPMRGGTR
jgi:hypothetical protein